MRVIARDCQNVPAHIEPYLRNVRLTSERCYDVYGVAFFPDGAFVFIIDDENCPRILPQHAFETVDESVPRDWVCTLLVRNDEMDCFALLGPRFFAKDLESYESLVQLESDAVDQFWKYARPIDD